MPSGNSCSVLHDSPHHFGNPNLRLTEAPCLGSSCLGSYQSSALEDTGAGEPPLPVPGGRMPTGWVPSLLWVSRAGTTDLRCTWRPCWTLPVSDWVVWVLASPPQQPFPLIQQTKHRHTWGFPDSAKPVFILISSRGTRGHQAACFCPVTAESHSTRRVWGDQGTEVSLASGDTDWWGVSKHQEGGAAGHTQGCRDP